MGRLFTCISVCLVLLLSSISTGMAEMHERLRSVQGDFIQETHLKILARPLVSHGAFAFQAPQSLRWEYLDPLHSIMFMHNGKVEKVIERDGNFQPDNGAGVGSMQVILPEIGNWLDGRFSENPVFTTARIDERTIVLTPKEPALQKIISSIELHLGQQEGVMDSVTVCEGPDDYTRMSFTNIILNREIPDSHFSR